MKQDNVKERRLKDYKEFKSDSDKFQKSGDGNRTEMESDHGKAHPGYNKIKAEDLYTKHDSNVYHAFGIEVDENSDETNNHVKARLKNPRMLDDKEQDKVDVREKGYDDEGFTHVKESKDNENKNKKASKDYDEETEEGYYHERGGPGENSFDGVSENENENKDEMKKEEKQFESIGRILSFKGFKLYEEYESQKDEEYDEEVEESEELEEAEEVEEAEELEEAEEVEVADEEDEEDEEEEKVEESLGKKGHPIKDDSQLKNAKAKKKTAQQEVIVDELKGDGKGKHPIKDDSQLKKATASKEKQNLSNKAS